MNALHSISVSTRDFTLGLALGLGIGGFIILFGFLGGVFA